MNIRRYNSTYFKHKLYDSSIRKAIISSIDHNRIQKEYPHLQKTYETKKDEYKHKILPTYEEYISKVSIEIMAISLELSVFCILMCDMIRPKKMVDFGSGYSSYIFRSLTSIIGEDYQPAVWSVDDSAEWINKTKTFLGSHNISSDNVITWDAFIQQNLDPFDFILYDLGGFEFRKENLKQIIKLCDKNGMIIFDDMHSAEYGRYLNKILKKNNCTCFDIRYYSKDKFGRYSKLAVF
jgi:hypothetical protein